MPHVPPLTRESIERARDSMMAERIAAAQAIGIPRDVIDLCQVHGKEQVQDWLEAYDALVMARRQS